MQCTRQRVGGAHVFWIAHATPFSDKKGAVAIFANDAYRSASIRETLARHLLVFRRRMNFFPSPYFLSLPSENMLAQPKLKVVIQFLLILIMTLILLIAFNLF